MPCCLYCVLCPVAHNEANATQRLYKTELSSKTEKITSATAYVETYHNTNLFLSSESQRIIQL